MQCEKNRGQGFKQSLLVQYGTQHFRKCLGLAPHQSSSFSVSSTDSFSKRRVKQCHIYFGSYILIYCRHSPPHPAGQSLYKYVQDCCWLPQRKHGCTALGRWERQTLQSFRKALINLTNMTLNSFYKMSANSEIPSTVETVWTNMQMNKTPQKMVYTQQELLRLRLNATILTLSMHKKIILQPFNMTSV